VLIEDRANRLLVLEYAEGIPVNEITGINPTQLPALEVERIQKAWEASREKVSFGDFNTVYSFGKHKFLPFDGG